MGNTVLILELDRDVGATIQAMVEAMGGRATSVCSVDAALTLLTQKPIDVLVTNCLYVSTLKKISLPWLAKQLQPSVRVVLTAAGEPVNVNAVNELDAYMPKPFAPADIRSALAQLPKYPPYETLPAVSTSAPRAAAMAWAGPA